MTVKSKFDFISLSIITLGIFPIIYLIERIIKRANKRANKSDLIEPSDPIERLNKRLMILDAKSKEIDREIEQIADEISQIQYYNKNDKMINICMCSFMNNNMYCSSDMNAALSKSREALRKIDEMTIRLTLVESKKSLYEKELIKEMLFKQRYYFDLLPRDIAKIIESYI